MNLAEEVRRGLEVFSGNSPFSESQFEVLTKLVFEVLLKRNSESAIYGMIKGVDAVLLKQGYAALVGVVLEAAKVDAEPLLLK